MKYIVSLEELDKKIENTKLELLNAETIKDEKRLYFTLKDLFTFRYIIEYNRNSSIKMKLNDLFSRTPIDKKQMEKFCSENNYNKKFDISYSGSIKEFMKKDLFNSVIDIYNVFNMPRSCSNINRKFSQEEVVYIVKSFYKDINNLSITNLALDILNSNHIEFVKDMPRYYDFAAGLFVLDDYILVKRDDNSIYDVIRLAHEVAHYVDSILSSKFIDDKFKLEWVPLAVEFISLDYLKTNRIITEEEYSVLMQKELNIISEYMTNTILFERPKSEYLKSLVQADSYALARRVLHDNRIDGNELYKCMEDENSFIDFNRENHEFIVNEFKKTKRFR